MLTVAPDSGPSTALLPQPSVPAPSTCALERGYFQAIYIARSSGEADSLCVVRHWHSHSAHIATMLRNSPSLNWSPEDVSKLGEWGFQFLTGIKGKASWLAVLSTYCDNFLPYVAQRLGLSRPAKQQRANDKQRAARAALEAAWSAALGEQQLREIEPVLATPAPEAVPVPIVSNSLVVWVGPHAGGQTTLVYCTPSRQRRQLIIHQHLPSLTYQSPPGTPQFATAARSAWRTTSTARPRTRHGDCLPLSLNRSQR